MTPAARLCAVTSRRLETAQAFADEHGAERAFDNVNDMIAWDGIDAVYIAIPTSLREDVAVAAATAGKHVLVEKPFVSLESLKRITAACSDNGVAFMDATHFVHHPRYAVIQKDIDDTVGQPRSLKTRFEIGLNDPENIRYNPALEPLGAPGDLGWYSMRATVEYLVPGVSLTSAQTRLERDAETRAIIAAEGSLTFDDESVSNWQCRFDASSVDISAELTGPLGVLRMNNFIGENEDHTAEYSVGDSSSDERQVRIASERSGPALMFEEFAMAVADASLRKHWMRSSERTQALLDAALAAVERS